MDGVFSMFSPLVPVVPTACTVDRKINANESFLLTQLNPEVALTTEVGASASAQIISFKASTEPPPKRIEDKINAQLPIYIRAYGAERVPMTFYARSKVSGLGWLCGHSV
jgi:tRNA U38,U39,U40 pseudouridine synthase TruA